MVALLAVAMLSMITGVGPTTAAAATTSSTTIDVVVRDGQGAPLRGSFVGLHPALGDSEDPNQLGRGDRVDGRFTDGEGRAQLEAPTPDAGAQRYHLVVFGPAEQGLLPTTRLVTVDHRATITVLDALMGPDGAVLVTLQVPNLEVEVRTPGGEPSVLAQVTLEERHPGTGPAGWIPSERVLPAFGYRSSGLGWTWEDGVLSARLEPPADPNLQLRLLVTPWDAPTFEQPLTVSPEGLVAFPEIEQQVGTTGRRVILAPIVPEPVEEAPEWLVHVNRLRAHAGLSHLEQREDWNRAAALHARYATANRWFAHDEDPSLPGHTLAGRWATFRGNLTHGSAPRDQMTSIYGWVNSPGHGGSVLSPTRRYVGYGEHFRPDAGDYAYSAVLPIAAGRWRDVVLPEVVRFPQAGARMGVPIPQAEQCGLTFDGSTTWSPEAGARLCTLHLFLLDEQRGMKPLSADRFTAEVRIDGRAVGTRIVGTSHAGHLAIVLDEPLSPDTTVEVDVREDGRVVEDWSFTTVTLDQEVPPTPGPVPTPITRPDPGSDPDPEPTPEPTPEPEPGPVPDPVIVPLDVAGTTHEAAILAVLRAGIATGFQDGTFGPGLPVTRAQMATFLDRALGLEPAPPAGFVDVPAGAAHADAIARLVAAGITTGFEDGTFRPGAAVTRGQMATFLDRALGLEAAAPAGFSDVAAGTTHGPAIDRLVAAGIAQGHPDGTYRPAGQVTRGQMAAFLARAFGITAPETDTVG